MRYLAFALAMIGAAMTAQAQTATPDLRGTWKGAGKSIIFGNNPHHPGSETLSAPPRVQDFAFTFVIDGQDGRLVWGHSLSKAAGTNEPFAWAIAADGKTIMGADTDGYYTMSVQSPDRMEMCYAHAGISPTKSIVAACFMVDREKK
jgi:hypothetical protein